MVCLWCDVRLWLASFSSLATFEGKTFWEPSVCPANRWHCCRRGPDVGGRGVSPCCWGVCFPAAVEKPPEMTALIMVRGVEGSWVKQTVRPRTERRARGFQCLARGFPVDMRVAGAMLLRVSACVCTWYGQYVVAHCFQRPSVV